MVADAISREEGGEERQERGLGVPTLITAHTRTCVVTRWAILLLHIRPRDDGIRRQRRRRRWRHPSDTACEHGVSRGCAGTRVAQRDARPRRWVRRVGVDQRRRRRHACGRGRTSCRGAVQGGGRQQRVGGSNGGSRLAGAGSQARHRAAGGDAQGRSLPPTPPPPPPSPPSRLSLRLY